MRQTHPFAPKKKIPSSQVLFTCGYADQQKQMLKKNIATPAPQQAEAPAAPVAEESGEGEAKKKRVPRAAGKGEVGRKRGPPRPHRKLTQPVLEGRIGKLQKRIERARGQLEDAERHIEGYSKEAKYRADESKNDQTAAVA